MTLSRNQKTAGTCLFCENDVALQGLSSAQDTLGSQAYGANDRAGVISWSVTTSLCMSVLAVPMAVVLYFGDALAIWIFQQPVEVADVRLVPPPTPSFPCWGWRVSEDLASTYLPMPHLQHEPTPCADH